MPLQYLFAVDSSSGAATRQCPHCQVGRTQRYGYFHLRDGSRQQRYRCQGCARTFIAHTNTPLAYLKRRSRWKHAVWCMRQGYSIRNTARVASIHTSTAFRWRHRLLHALDQRPQPTISGGVVADTCWVPYSEKGSRRTNGPGACPRNHKGRRFRRFVDGRPNCVLLMKGRGAQAAAVILGQGRPTLDSLIGALKRFVQTGVNLCADRWPLIAEACESLGLTLQEWFGRPVDRQTGLDRGFPRGLYWWLKRFRGVATKYLSHYLCWYLGSKDVAGIDLGYTGRIA